MASIKKKSGGGGGANWMDTYGDMVTLLLCFFVLLYSISTIDQEKWMVFVKSFNRDAIDEVEPIPGPVDDPDGTGGKDLPLPDENDMVDEALVELYDYLTEYIESSAVASDSISVSMGDDFVFISFDDAVFFDGNKSDLRQDGKIVLDALIPAIAEAGPYIDEVRVLGHTAQSRNIPNTSIVDRTLAAQRAAVVVAYFQDSIGYEVIHPGRYVAEGYGQWRNVADNSTAEGKARNRRVEIIISGRDLENELNDDYRQYYTMSDTNTGNTTEFTADGNAAVSYSTNGN